MKISLDRTLLLPGFPSASALAWHHQKLYIIGDDATFLQVMDAQYNVLESISLFASPETRIPKKTKPDLEAVTIIDVDGEPNLLVIGSASKFKQHRSIAKLIGLQNAGYPSTVHSTQSFFESLLGKGIAEINIEGAATLKKSLVLANRGNKTNPSNTLIFTPQHFWEANSVEWATFSQLDLPNLDAGISGLDYVAENDSLLFTASTEDTLTAIDDGAIGDSYIGMIKDIHLKIKDENIIPDHFVNLSAINPVFQHKKIESLCVENFEDGLLTMHICADNDDGQSTLFKLLITL